MTGQNSGLTSEQFQLALRLEGIFMPYARKQRDEAFRRQGSSAVAADAEARFVHYTSAEAALSIIKTKRLWMRNTTCMSDYREVQHGFEILRKFFSDPNKLEEFTKALDLSVPGGALEAINLFNQHWDTIRLNTYITSISEHQDKEDFHGRLSMWRAFGSGNAARVAIVFKIPWFTGAGLAVNVFVSPVAYLTEDEATSVINSVITNVKAEAGFLCTVDRQIVIGTIFQTLLEGVTCLKHEGFKEELEWRGIYCPKLRSSPLIEQSTEIIAGVPQLVYKFPLDATVSPVFASLDFARVFDRLIIGPSPYPWVMYEAFGDALTRAGVTDAPRRVWTSNIPIRS
jgi:hypothetical protein